MKFFEKKKNLKKIAIICLIFLSFQFVFSPPVKAKDQGFFGNFNSPFVMLIVALGDRNYEFLALQILWGKVK